jgi:hypothetical protein
LLFAAFARQLVLDRNPDLADQRDSVEALQQRQQTIKDKIAAMRQANPKLTFAAAWTKLQQQKPDLFEGLD